jgi:hypothetical protein
LCITMSLKGSFRDSLDRLDVANVCIDFTDYVDFMYWW